MAEHGLLPPGDGNKRRHPGLLHVPRFAALQRVLLLGPVPVRFSSAAHRDVEMLMLYLSVVSHLQGVLLHDFVPRLLLRPTAGGAVRLQQLPQRPIRQLCAAPRALDIRHPHTPSDFCHTQTDANFQYDITLMVRPYTIATFSLPHADLPLVGALLCLGHAVRDECTWSDCDGHGLHHHPQ